jgi:hypothetical protein
MIAMSLGILIPTLFQETRAMLKTLTESKSII